MSFPDNFPKPHETYFKASLDILLGLERNESVDKLIKGISSGYKINTVPFWVIKWVYAHQDKIKLSKDVLNLIKIKKVRSLSGIVPVSVFTKPHPCPGNCIFCPNETGVPKSYLHNEPGIMRAQRNNFDPSEQFFSRLSQLNFSGHEINKVDLIIQGGTFSNLPNEYREQFIAACFAQANSWPSKLAPNDIYDLVKEHGKNEKAKIRIIGITIETRPDWINEKEIIFLRKLGVTRVELGVQNISDGILSLNNRTHTTNDIINATKLLKDSGLKICYHLMPGLYGSNLKDDLNNIKKVFSDPAFRPDYLKIYPCVVLKNTKLLELYKKKKYEPLTDHDLIDLLIEVKKIVPEYVRIQRLGRDIPANSIAAGCKISNIRELVLKKSYCKCIRCREIKDQKNHKVHLNIISYTASGGTEYFLEMVDKDYRLYAILRLRFPQEFYIKELQDSAVIRELHTYGAATGIGKKGKIQHLGLGKLLIEVAETISKSHGYKKIAVISGIGARDYYRKLGYKLKDTYMIKDLL